MLLNAVSCYDVSPSHNHQSGGHPLSDVGHCSLSILTSTTLTWMPSPSLSQDAAHHADMGVHVTADCTLVLLLLLLMLDYIFVNCNWVHTRWQQYSTHLHTNST